MRRTGASPCIKRECRDSSEPSPEPEISEDLNCKFEHLKCLHALIRFQIMYQGTVIQSKKGILCWPLNVTPEIRTQTLLSLMCQSVKVEKRELSVNS